MKAISFLGRFVLQVIGGFIIGMILAYILYTSSGVEVDGNPGDLMGGGILINLAIIFIGFIVGFSVGFVIVWLVLISVFRKNNNSSGNTLVKNIDKSEEKNKVSVISNRNKKTINIENNKERIFNNSKSETSFSIFDEFLTTKKRLSRKPFFYRIFIFMIIKYAIIFYIDFDTSFFSPTFFDDGSISYIIFLLVSQIIIFILFLIQIIRRLYDINQSHWYAIIYFLPLFDWILLIFLSLKNGTIGENEYGGESKKLRPFKNPLANDVDNKKSEANYKLFSFKKGKQ